MAYRLHYAGYPSTAMGPPDPDHWTGPPGPAGPSGPPGPPVTARQATAHVSLSSASASALVALNVSHLFVLQVRATSATPGNYTLELFDGDPSGAGRMVYQATGIATTLYDDVASCFLDMDGDLWVRLTQIDPVSVEVDVMVRFLDLN